MLTLIISSGKSSESKQQADNDVPEMSVQGKPTGLSYAYPIQTLAPEAKRFQWFLKKGLDILLSGSGLIFLAPLLLIIMILIKLDSPGPCFIRQRRVGYLGKEFYMFKFRSMVQNADACLTNLIGKNETNELMFKMKKDPRVTRVGYWLRRYSLDELPQLYNVLKGEMSLVGPRPPLPDEVKKYRKGYLRRLGTVPGLTCYWQISGRSDIKDFRQVVQLDEEYIQNWSLLVDFQILFKTLPVVISAKGAA
jgi:exopolysaccharide biosynthesis polyprenyl glycosylphosphotransferase